MRQECFHDYKKKQLGQTKMRMEEQWSLEKVVWFIGEEISDSALVRKSYPYFLMKYLRVICKSYPYFLMKYLRVIWKSYPYFLMKYGYNLHMTLLKFHEKCHSIRSHIIHFLQFPPPSLYKQYPLPIKPAKARNLKKLALECLPGSTKDMYIDLPSNKWCIRWWWWCIWMMKTISNCNWSITLPLVLKHACTIAP